MTFMSVPGMLTIADDTSLYPSITVAGTIPMSFFGLTDGIGVGIDAALNFDRLNWPIWPGDVLAQIRTTYTERVRRTVLERDDVRSDGAPVWARLALLTSEEWRCLLHDSMWTASLMNPPTRWFDLHRSLPDIALDERHWRCISIEPMRQHFLHIAGDQRERVERMLLRAFFGHVGGPLPTRQAIIDASSLTHMLWSLLVEERIALERESSSYRWPLSRRTPLAQRLYLPRSVVQPLGYHSMMNSALQQVKRELVQHERQQKLLLQQQQAADADARRRKRSSPKQVMAAFGIVPQRHGHGSKKNK